MALVGLRHHRRPNNHVCDSLAITSNVVFVRLTTSMYSSQIGNAISCGTSTKVDQTISELTPNTVL